MKFYHQLQLNQAGSKKLIGETPSKKVKLQRIMIYVFKVLLTVTFCFLFVTGFSILFGSDNSIVGVVTLLCILVMRQADLGIDSKHSVFILISIFGIFAAGPHLSNLLPSYGAFAVNLISIFSIVLFTCHDMRMSNQSTFVLGYLLLQGYDVSGHAFDMRLWGLLLGALITAAVFYKNHRKRSFDCNMSNIFTDFDLSSKRSQWQIRFTLILCTLMFILDAMGMQRVMWAGIAAMSVITPETDAMNARMKWRAPGNVIGCILFIILAILLPENIFVYIGIIGGICIGFSASYGWQTIFNTFGALYIASGLFGVPTAIFLRIFHNTIGSVFSMLMDKGFRLLQKSSNAAG